MYLDNDNHHPLRHREDVEGKLYLLPHLFMRQAATSNRQQLTESKKFVFASPTDATASGLFAEEILSFSKA